MKASYERHEEPKEMVPCDADSARWAAACGATVEDHFDGGFGLRRVLLNAGTMNEEGPIIKKHNKHRDKARERGGIKSKAAEERASAVPL